MRREGQVPTSRDLVALAVIPLLLWLTFDWAGIEQRLRRMMAELVATGFNPDIDVIIKQIVPGFSWSLAYFILPILIVAALLIVLLSIIDTGGLVFSVKPIAPRFERLNPGEGIKRMFSARTAAESAISLIKLFVFGLVAALLLWGSISTIQQVQACGARCMPEIFRRLIIPMIVTSCAILIIAALGDFIVSRLLYRFEMRMTDTELKRENKDNYGSPELKQRRREQGREFMSAATRLGASAATLIVMGRNAAVGLRYVQGETAAPVVVVKGTGAGADEILAIARSSGIPIHPQPTLTAVLTQRGMPGQFVPTDLFTDVAAAIIATEQRS